MSKTQHNTDDQRRPFQGLRSFEEKNKSEFGGRDTEIKELLALVEDLGLTVVFGKSGIGKTSVLQAGLMPALRKKFYYPTYIRIDYSSSKTPLQQVKDLLFESLVEMDPSTPPMDDVSLWEYMHDVDFMKGLVTPVLILDQFEEIFTLGEKNSGVKELVTELADLVENRIPASTKEKYREQGKIVPSRYSKLSYRVVLSLREDYLARLEELKKFMPSIMDNRLRVVQMTISQAMDAAMKPAKDLINKSVAEDIIKILPGVSQSDFDLLKQKGTEDQKLKVEPFLLSLICDRINEKRIEKGLDVITSELVSEFNVSDVINSFYNDTTSKYGQNVEHAIEDLLLTDGGFRKLQALGEMQRKYDISDQVIDELVSARIIRKEARDGVAYVELIHDVLAPVIKKKRDKRIEQEKELQRLEAIKLERAKNRRRFKRIGSIIGVVLIGLVTFSIASSAKVRENNEQKDRKTRSREMLLSATSSSIYTSEWNDKGHSALLSRLAYGLYVQDRENINGINEIDWKFYTRMMKSNFNLKKTKQFKDELSVSAAFTLQVKDKSDYIDEPPISKLSDGDISFSAPDKKKTQSLDKSTSSKVIENSMTPIKLVRIDHLSEYLVAYNDATVRKLTLNDSSIKLLKKPVFENLDPNSVQRVSAMAYDSVGKRLAIVKRDTIHLYDKENTKQEETISIPSSAKKDNLSESFLKYNPDESIILARKDKLYRWDNTYTEPISWPDMKTKKWVISEDNLKIQELDLKKETTISPKVNLMTKSIKPSATKSKPAIKVRKKTKAKSKREFELTIKPEPGFLSFTSKPKSRRGLSIRALSVAKNSLIALAIKNRLIIIDENTVHEIAYSKWDEITAISFDPTGTYLVLGDRFGVVYHIDIPSSGDFSTANLTRHIAHSKEIFDISFSPNDSNKIATASQDGTVAIWNRGAQEQQGNSWWNSIWMKEKEGKMVWSALLLDSSLFEISEPAINISFSQKGGYLLVVYDNGNTIRWPSSLEKINKMICKKSKKKGFKTDSLSDFMEEHQIDKADKKYYCCECEN